MQFKLQNEYFPMFKGHRSPLILISAYEGELNVGQLGHANDWYCVNYNHCCLHFHPSALLGCSQWKYREYTI